MPVISDAVHAEILRFFPELVRELGGDPDLLLRAAGIDPASLADGCWGATYSQLAALLGQAAHILDCPDFGLRLATRQRGIRIYGPLGVVMRNSRTFGGGVRFVSEHAQAHSLAARVWLKRDDGGEGIFVGHDILLGGVATRAQAIEQILLVGHLGAMELTGGVARARRVHFRHQPASPMKVYRRYFRCEVRFGQAADGILFHLSDMTARIVDPDAGLYGIATTEIETMFGTAHPPLHAQVRGIVMRELGSDRCSNDRVARDLGLHPRVLHRRLRAEGTSFQRIKDEVRRDAMHYFLERTTMDFGQISELLGFAEQSVMTRFCNRMFAVPPTIVRDAARRG